LGGCCPGCACCAGPNIYLIGMTWHKLVLNVSFICIDERISPVTAEFLIPTVALNEIDSVVIGTLCRILTKMGDPPSCEKFRIGEASTYSWAEWEDKNVTVLYIDFLIGC